MAISTLSRERLVELLPRVVVEDNRTFANRLNEERSYFKRRVSMAYETVAEYPRSETLRMYEDFLRDLTVFDQTPFPRRRWFSIAGIRIPLVAK